MEKKKRQKTNATARSLKRLRENGWIAWVVEKWIPPRGKMKFGIRQDVWGFGDILACRPEIFEACRVCLAQGILPIPAAMGQHVPCRTCGASGKILIGTKLIALVQCFPNTSGQFAAHRRKVLEIPEHKTWLEAGGKIFLQGWAKQGPRGQAKHWIMREEEL